MSIVSMSAAAATLAVLSFIALSVVTSAIKMALFLVFMPLVLVGVVAGFFVLKSRKGRNEKFAGGNQAAYQDIITSVPLQQGSVPVQQYQNFVNSFPQYQPYVPKATTPTPIDNSPSYVSKLKGCFGR